MKRVTFGVFKLCFSLLALLLTGCGDGEKHAKVETHEKKASIASNVTFSAKKGLHVPAETASIIGLELADVEERIVAAAFEFSAQVYRAANETQFASSQPTGTPAAMATGSVSANDAIQLRDGQRVWVQRRKGGAPLSGRILALQHNFPRDHGEVEVLLAIADDQEPLSLGDFVSVTVPLNREEAVTSIPRSAVFRTAEGDFVYAVSGERYVRTQIKLGAANEEFVEVTDGLYAGDQVVLRPVMTLWLAELQAIRGGKACADGH